ncbi:epoxyqueuosine reductase QueH [bacterium]|nr:epoxyqueuosine reductase QueH [bacterium]
MKRLLLHVCCAPCTCYVHQCLSKDKKYAITGFWYNPNIHPFLEYQKRMMTLGYYSNEMNLPLIRKTKYSLEEWMEIIKDKYKEKDKRCLGCYQLRLEETAKRAKKEKFDSFSTTLLYSKFQMHENIKELGQKLAHTYNIEFYYQDFRLGWKEGIEISKKLDLYRQQYCGCIFSEKERFDAAAEK